MTRDRERLERIQDGLKEAGLDGMVCTLPANVLLASGYFPVVGTSIAIVARDGERRLLIPEDEYELACDYVERTVTFQPGSLDCLTNAVEAVRAPLANALREMKLDHAAVGYESDAAFQPASYASMHLYGGAIQELCAGASLNPASELLARMKSVLTMVETDRVRRACRIAEIGYEEGAEKLVTSLQENEAAAHFRAPMGAQGIGFEGVARADGYVFCMSGPNAAKACAAYARTRGREIEVTDFVLVHCNSHADGYWTDITRTYTIGTASDRQYQMYEAVFEARAAAIAAVKPGVTGADVDAAARDVLRSRGFGEQFKHGTGHGVGFAAINHNAYPRIHPKSQDRLERGMVFNIEPAIYIDGFGGLRHCDMVAVTADGAEVLTPFQCTVEELIR